jgi:hypothetical protein
MCYLLASVMQLEFFIIFKAIHPYAFIMLIHLSHSNPRRFEGWNLEYMLQILARIKRSFFKVSMTWKQVKHGYIHTIVCVLVLTFAFQMWMFNIFLVVRHNIGLLVAFQIYKHHYVWGGTKCTVASFMM